MDHIPSQSISKSVLIVTPLFLLVLAVLHSSSQLSYLFILKFINNVAGSADITFLPTLQPQISHQQFVRQDLMTSFGLRQQLGQQVQGFNVPLVDLASLQKWVDKNQLIKGISPRWLIPCRIGTIDTILLVVNATKEKQIGVIGQDMPSFDQKEVLMEELLSHKLGLEVGDVVPINFKLRNFPNGLKLFQKFQQVSSDQQYKLDQDPTPTQSQLSTYIFNLLTSTNPDLNIDQQKFNKTFKILYQSEINAKYTLKHTYYPQGMYPSAIGNVVMMEIGGFVELLGLWFVGVVGEIGDGVDVRGMLPEEYRGFWPKNQLQARAASVVAKSQLQTFFKNYSLLSICTLKNRQQIYHPHSSSSSSQSSSYHKFTKMLQQTPTNLQLIVIYPFFEQSLAIKYFFDSVIQIFQFVTCIVYFYTMVLIMKQVYQEKEVQVGIWRVLGAGGLGKRKVQPIQVELQEQSLQSRGSSLKYSSQFHQKLPLSQHLKFLSKLLTKVGYLNYWLITTTASILLYYLLKLLFYYTLCTKLGFTPISQPLSNLVIIFFGVFGFIQLLVYQHIRAIYGNSLSQTIKPVKRTFDVVKVRVIHVATFGVSMEVLLIAVMLVYYGVVSYYWIPFAVIDGQQDLQVLLFNTIFLFMIFGSIILLGIAQPRLQTTIFSLLFRLSPKFQTLKLPILKNIKAKQYKNIKVTIIISIIFAFVLFFTAGIKIQMQIVQSFIERALGAALVFQNYQKVTFDSGKIDGYLGDKGVQYAWLSRNLNRDNITISLVSHITKQRITPQIQVLTPEYLNSTFSQYYYPQQYLPQSPSYWKLPNSLSDGFNSIYTGQKGAESVGKYDEHDTIREIDPYGVGIENLGESGSGIQGGFAGLGVVGKVMAPQEQVVRVVVSAGLRKNLGVNVGDYYKMQISTLQNRNTSYFLRAQITHSFKAGPGFDLLGQKAFISSQQAAYIYRILGAPQSQILQNQKLFIKASPQTLKTLSPTILTLSPSHTQMFQLEFVSKSFSLLSTYLNAYIVLITGVMSTLVTIFIFLYTIGKCREEAQMYKMLRAIGLSARNIRVMVFSQVMVRLVVAILGGIGLGVVFSVGFSLQIQEFLMIKTPLMDITVVSIIGIVLTLIFSLTIIRATRYISQKTVAETNKL